MRAYPILAPSVLRADITEMSISMVSLESYLREGSGNSTVLAESMHLYSVYLTGSTCELFI